jgi:hypothetical protein
MRLSEGDRVVVRLLPGPVRLTPVVGTVTDVSRVGWVRVSWPDGAYGWSRLENLKRV